MSKKRKSFLKSLDPYDWFFILVAFISIGYGLYRAYDMGPDWWGNVAGPLFSLASGFLFVVALRMQLREHRHALEEMEQNNTNHADLLLVAKQEKEFRICLSAIEKVTEEVKSWGEKDFGPLEVIQSILELWESAVKHQNIQGEDVTRMFQELHNIDEVLTGFDRLDALNVRMYWALHAVNRKDLAGDDRQYLNSLIIPLVVEVGRAQARAGIVQQCLEELHGLDDDDLRRKRFDRIVIAQYLAQVKRFNDRKSYREPQPRPVGFD